MMSFIQREGRASTRSFRVDRALNNELEAEAEKQGVTVSYILETLVEDYLNQYRWADRFVELALQPHTLNEFLEHLDKDTLSEIGYNAGSTTPRQRLLMRGKEVNEENVMEIIKTLGDYDNWFSISFHDAEEPYLFIRNKHGNKWAIFLESYLTGLYKNILGIEIKCKRIGDNIQVTL